MKEAPRDGIIVPGEGANSNKMHSSRLSTSLF